MVLTALNRCRFNATTSSAAMGRAFIWSWRRRQSGSSPSTSAGCCTSRQAADVRDTVKRCATRRIVTPRRSGAGIRPRISFIPLEPAREKRDDIVCYDVGDDRRRQRLSEALLDFGTRVEESVFQCRIEPALAKRCCGVSVRSSRCTRTRSTSCRYATRAVRGRRSTETEQVRGGFCGPCMLADNRVRAQRGRSVT